MARGTKIWLNGQILPEEAARISLFTHAFHYGTGAFEGIRAYKQTKGGGAVFRLREHVSRLFDSMKILGLQIPFTEDQIVSACTETCKANGFEECYIRPVAYVGDGPLGVYYGKNPPIHLAVLVWEWGSYLGDKGANEGVRLKISSLIRPHVNSVMTKGKITGQYATGTMAKAEAISMGYDEGLLLDPEGYLTEGTGENLFIVRDGLVKTTPLNSILNGITRNTIINRLKHLGFPVQEVRFTRDELWCADEIFLTGTAAEVTPVREVDNRLIGRGPLAGKVGPISKQVMQDYARLVRGEHPDYTKEWLTPV